MNSHMHAHMHLRMHARMLHACVPARPHLDLQEANALHIYIDGPVGDGDSEHGGWGVVVLARLKVGALHSLAA